MCLVHQCLPFNVSDVDNISSLTPGEEQRENERQREMSGSLMIKFLACSV